MSLEDLSYCSAIQFYDKVVQAFPAATVQFRGIWNLKDTRKLWQHLEHEICFKKLALIFLCFACQDEQHKCQKSDMGRIHVFVQNKYYFSRWLLRILENVTLKKSGLFVWVFFILEINLPSWWATYSFRSACYMSAYNC